MAELVCSAPSLPILSPSVYLTELYPAQHVQPVSAMSYSQIDEVVQPSAVLMAPGFRWEGQMVMTPSWTDAEVADKYCCKLPLCD